MPNKRDLVLLNGLAIGLVLLILLGGCGIFTGNPENPSMAGGAPDGIKFLDPTAEYLSAQSAKTPDQTNCGYFTGQSAQAEVDAGRKCVRDAFAGCREAFYLFDETKADKSRFAAFVAVLPDCQLKVHAVSNDPSRFVGDETKTCWELSEPIEMSCGVGN